MSVCIYRWNNFVRIRSHNLVILNYINDIETHVYIVKHDNIYIQCVYIWL